MQRHPGLAPGPVAGRALYAEGVLAGGQGGVGRKPAVAADLVPVAIQSFQLVSIAVRRRIEITQCGESKREDVLLMREGEVAGVDEGLLRGECPPISTGTPIQPQICEDDRRNVGSSPDLVRVEGGGAAKSAKKHLSAGTFKARTPPRQVFPRKTVCAGVVGECLRDRIKS